MASDPTLIEGFALSPQQARLWRWQQDYLAPSCRSASLWIRVPRDTVEARLRESLERVIERHEILRTQYRQIPGIALPVQVIEATLPPRWQVPEGVHGDSSISVSLIPLSDGGVRVCLYMPSVHADAASLYQLAAEWAGAYLGTASKEAPLQYADYAAWRSDLIESDPNAQAFWRQECSTVALPAQLPLRGQGWDSSSQIEMTALSLTIPPSLRALWKESRETSGTQYALRALGAWVTLLYQHSETERFTLGIDWQERGGHLGDAIGLFSEPLPLTPEALGSHTAETLLQSLGRRCAALHEWRDYFPSQEQEKLLALGFRYLPMGDMASLAAAGWEIERLDSPTAPCRLLLECRITPGGPEFTLHYDRSLYDAQAAELLGEQLFALLEAGIRQPTRRLQELSALSPTERRLVEEVFCRSKPLPAEREEEYERIASLPHLAACFSEAARQRPADIAVKSASGSLCYAELEERSSRLAQALLARGVVPGGRVVHFLSRDLDAIVAMLAILKAGAVYVPIDPGYPASRIAFQIEDCGAEFILTRRALFSRLPSSFQEEGRLLFTNEAQESATPFVAPDIRPEHTAYLIYTSGSTGEPKGVPITHASALHSLAARLAYYPEPVRRFLLLSSFAFDSSLAGIFWTLAQGGCLYLCSEAEQKDPIALAKIICEEGTTHLLALPSLYQLLLQQLEGRSAALTTAIVAGEACPRALVEAHHRVLPKARLYNEYGPTEAAVWSTVSECLPEPASHPVSIGRPIPRSSVYLLDAHQQPVARGLKGEIYIGGPGLSPGYLHRPTLTEERFVHLGAERLYRTGDYAYRDERGDLVFLGRADAQIKIRGYRVELGEIEAALRRVSGAEQVAVLAEQGEDGQVSLRAFLEAAQPPDIEALRQKLAGLLPEFMVPGDLQALPMLPRTANGKLDRSALLALKPRQQRAAYVAPRDHTERVLASLWEDLLATEFIGRDDDFFALGGHSLLVVRLVHRIKSALHLEIPVSEVFENRTLAALAHSLNAGAPQRALIPLRPGDSERPPLFCLHQPSGGVHHYLPLIEKLPAAQPAYGIPLPAGRNGENSTIEGLAAEYLAHIQTLQPHGPYYLCGWSMGGLLALEIAHQLEQRHERVAFLALFDTTPRAEDEPLPFARLLEVLRQELTPESAALLDTLPEDALATLRKANDGVGRVEQLRHLLLTWAPQQGLRCKAPTEVIEAMCEAMQNARLWVSRYQPPVVASDLHIWWAQDTLTHNENLPAAWQALSRGEVRHITVPGDHDEILQRPELHASFCEALTTAWKDQG